MRIRPADRGDSTFLHEMLVEAVNWDEARASLTASKITARHEFAHYVSGWPRTGDAGVVAVDDAERSVGAAWYRTFPADDRGFGYVDAETPEVSIGVVHTWRGRGVGGAMLGALEDLARARGVGALSLSVEKANPARRLYERSGWVVVRDDGDTVTMQRTTRRST